MLKFLAENLFRSFDVGTLTVKADQMLRVVRTVALAAGETARYRKQVVPLSPNLPTIQTSNILLISPATVCRWWRKIDPQALPSAVQAGLYNKSFHTDPSMIHQLYKGNTVFRI